MRVGKYDLVFFFFFALPHRRGSRTGWTMGGVGRGKNGGGRKKSFPCVKKRETLLGEDGGFRAVEDDGTAGRTVGFRRCRRSGQTSKGREQRAD